MSDSRESQKPLLFRVSGVLTISGRGLVAAGLRKRALCVLVIEWTYCTVPESSLRCAEASR
jgi:hypothetical protein